jgi:hypothetical protein
MSLKDFKKNKKRFTRICFKGGFALLFSVLVSSLLLTIGLSIFSIALKELAISTASRQSIYAFYAADSGRECALYWDIEEGHIATLVTGEDESELISCGSASSIMPYQEGNQITEEITTNIPSTDYDNNKGVILVSTIDGPNFSVTITKSWLDETKKKIVTTITSIGRDFVGGDRVERAITETY